MRKRGTALKNFSDCLSGRSQVVKIGKYVSDSENPTEVIPQGSILASTHFKIYINDLCTMTLPQCEIFTYADDTATLE